MKALQQDTLKEQIDRQRAALKGMLREPLSQAAQACSGAWGDRADLDAVLAAAFATLPFGNFMYAVDTNGIQVSSNISREGIIDADFGRDRSHRPYMKEAVPAEGFLLSRAYISERAKRPSLTAIQIVRKARGRVLGFVGVDFDLRDLPITRELSHQPTQWRQIKGDPSIRGAVFHQTRSNSVMDQNIDTVLGVVEELMVAHGVYHIILHFSSNRAVAWHIDDPYRYRLLDIQELTDPNSCLAYPRRPYPKNAAVAAGQIRPVLEGLRALRFMDEMLYLRSGTLNIFNGVVGLTFSCDGSHYVPVNEFLDKGAEFWVRGSTLGV
ncbi:MAG: hypothetical protein HXY26_00020 [Hydrogenophilaceae bacterium]|nr:hypothetical protein [Hydrogenophilaceae bacterium]